MPLFFFFFLEDLIRIFVWSFHVWLGDDDINEPRMNMATLLADIVEGCIHIQAFWEQGMIHEA